MAPGVGSPGRGDRRVAPGAARGREAERDEPRQEWQEGAAFTPSGQAVSLSTPAGVFSPSFALPPGCTRGYSLVAPAGAVKTLTVPGWQRRKPYRGRTDANRAMVDFRFGGRGGRRTPNCAQGQAALCFVVGIDALL